MYRSKNLSSRDVRQDSSRFLFIDRQQTSLSTSHRNFMKFLSAVKAILGLEILNFDALQFLNYQLQRHNFYTECLSGHILLLFKISQQSIENPLCYNRKCVSGQSTLTFYVGHVTRTYVTENLMIQKFVLRDWQDCVKV